jgi:hypothetical protein
LRGDKRKKIKDKTKRKIIKQKEEKETLSTQIIIKKQLITDSFPCRILATSTAAHPMLASIISLHHHQTSPF